MYMLLYLNVENIPYLFSLIFFEFNAILFLLVLYLESYCFEHDFSADDSSF